MSVVPKNRIQHYLPHRCPTVQQVPKIQPFTQLPDQGLTLPLKRSDDHESGNPYEHYSWRHGASHVSEHSPFEEPVWSMELEVPLRMHRFVRFFSRAQFQFATGPFQLVLELFDLDDDLGVASRPKCEKGCVGGTPVYNGQIIDHAMPSGYRFKLWLLAGPMPQIDERFLSKCLEFDFEYDIQWETKQTMFEVGVQHHMCDHTVFPDRIVQSTGYYYDELGEYTVLGGNIHISDVFGFNHDDFESMEHQMPIKVVMDSILRVTTHQSAETLNMVLFAGAQETYNEKPYCTSKQMHSQEGHESIVCMLKPGDYRLYLMADFALGGMPPCADFAMQFSLRPTALIEKIQCRPSFPSLQQFLDEPGKVRTFDAAIRWDGTAKLQDLWSETLTVEHSDLTSTNQYLRFAVTSDHALFDLRLVVKHGNRIIGDPVVLSNGYSIFIPLTDVGAYTMTLYTMTGEHLNTGGEYCAHYTVDFDVASKAKDMSSHTHLTQWNCKHSHSPLPDTLRVTQNDVITMDGVFAAPASGRHDIRLDVSTKTVIRAFVGGPYVTAKATLIGSGYGGSAPISGPGDHIFGVVQGGATLSIQLESATGASLSSCSEIQLFLVAIPSETLPECPWSPSPGMHQQMSASQATSAQRQAQDHLGNLMLDFMPKHISTHQYEDFTAKPISIWWSPQMQSRIPFSVDTETPVALRLEVISQPAWIPLEVMIVHDKGRGERDKHNVVADSFAMQNRLLIKQDELPPGNYALIFEVKDVPQDVHHFCSHLSIHLQIGHSDSDAQDSMRAEQLEMPEIQAPQGVPPSFNTVGWYENANQYVLASQVFSHQEQDRHNPSAVAKLDVEEDTAIRIISEPLDQKHPGITITIRDVRSNQVVATSDKLGDLSYIMKKGNYDVVFPGHDPHLITIGIASTRLLQEIAQESRSCSSSMPAMTLDDSKPTWSFAPAPYQLNNAFANKAHITTQSLHVKHNSLVYLEVGSNFILDFVRIGIKVAEGTWVAEQRGRKSSLLLDLPPGKYDVVIETPFETTGQFSHCVGFSVKINVVPMDSSLHALSTDKLDAQKELEFRDEDDFGDEECFSFGALPLPLDFTNEHGGSKDMGGPLSQDGRMMVRGRFVVTDLHDGRKTVDMQTRGKRLVIKLGVSHAGYSKFGHSHRMDVKLQTKSKMTITPANSWSHTSSMEYLWYVDGTNPANQDVKFVFRHDAANGKEGCMHFEMWLQVNPETDLQQMSSCTSPLGHVMEPNNFIRNMNLPLTMPTNQAYEAHSPLSSIREPAIGHLEEFKFTLQTPSYVEISAGHNFLLSHVEMDLARTLPGGGEDSMGLSEPLFVNHGDNPINIEERIQQTLQPGQYTIRWADDHDEKKFQGVQQLCFPHAFWFKAIPIVPGQPFVLSVMPNPTVPILMGGDLVITIRFSEAPDVTADTIADLVKFGGIASGGGDSWFSASNLLSSKGSHVSKMNVQDDGKTWMVGWDADKLETLKDGPQKLDISGIKNKRGQAFDTSHVGDLTYYLNDGEHIVDNIPWYGIGTADEFETHQQHSKNLWSRTMEWLGGSPNTGAPKPETTSQPAYTPPAPQQTTPKPQPIPQVKDTTAPSPAGAMPVLRDTPGDHDTSLPPMHPHVWWQDDETDDQVEKMNCGPGSVLNAVTGLCDAIAPDGTLNHTYWLILILLGVMIILSALRYIDLSTLPWSKLSPLSWFSRGQNTNPDLSGYQMTGMAGDFDDDL